MPRPELDPDHAYLTTAQAAALAEVSEAAIRQWVKRGHLKPAGRHARTRQMMFTQIAVAEAEEKTRKRGGRSVAA